MSRLVRNKNEENRPSSSGGDSVTVKNNFLSTNVRYVHKSEKINYKKQIMYEQNARGNLNSL